MDVIHPQYPTVTSFGRNAFQHFRDAATKDRKGQSLTWISTIGAQTPSYNEGVHGTTELCTAKHIRNICAHMLHKSKVTSRPQPDSHGTGTGSRSRLVPSSAYARQRSSHLLRSRNPGRSSWRRVWIRVRWFLSCTNSDKKNRMPVSVQSSAYKRRWFCSAPSLLPTVGQGPW